MGFVTDLSVDFIAADQQFGAATAQPLIELGRDEHQGRVRCERRPELANLRHCAWHRQPSVRAGRRGRRQKLAKTNAAKPSGLMEQQRQIIEH